MVYRQGKDNKVTNALSRTKHGVVHDLAVVVSVQSTWLQDIQLAYANDPKSAQLLQELSITSTSGHFSSANGII